MLSFPMADRVESCIQSLDKGRPEQTSESILGYALTSVIRKRLDGGAAIFPQVHP